MSSPVEFRGGEFTWSSGFAHRAIEPDFKKTFFADLEAMRCDILVVDFVDERWDLLRIGDSFVTLSADLMNSAVERLFRRGFRRVARHDPEIQMLWRDACARFAATIRERLPNVRIVLHRVSGADRYHDGRKVRALAPFADGIPLGQIRAVVEDCYSCFRSHGRDLYELDLPPTYLADPCHRWGISPFHYEERYYRDAAAKLSSL
jgi:hypothetical protein